MKKHKCIKKVNLLISMLLLLSISTSIFAKPFSNNTHQGRVYVGKTTIEKITVEDLPEGITPMVFDTTASRDKYIQNLQNKAFIKDENLISSQNSITAAANTSTLYKKPVSIGGCTVTLCTRVTTDGTRITEVSDYSTLSGYTAVNKWEVNDHDSYIYSSGRDFMSYVDGTLVGYLLVAGTLEVHRTPVYIEDYRTIFH